ncbi:MAG TPA: hypothetical protein VJC18_08370 [bacterium]|nr:hypothetical protein [bacterium]
MPYFAGQIIPWEKSHVRYVGIDRYGAQNTAEELSREHLSDGTGAFLEMGLRLGKGTTYARPHQFDFSGSMDIGANLMMFGGDTAVGVNVGFGFEPRWRQE